MARRSFGPGARRVPGLPFRTEPGAAGEHLGGGGEGGWGACERDGAASPEGA